MCRQSSLTPRSMKPDQERVKTLLADTVTLLCRNGLHFQRQLRVQGVLGITVDDADVFIVHINESFTEQGRGARLTDFQGPLGSGFTAQLVATLSGQPAVSNATATQPTISAIQKWHTPTKPKSETGTDLSQISAAVAPKRQKVDVPFTGMVHEAKNNGTVLQQHVAAVALPASSAVSGQWPFEPAQKTTQQGQRVSAIGEASFLPYTASTSGTQAVASQPVPNKRKANVYPPPQAMLSMSFCGLTPTVDYGSGMATQVTALQPASRDLCPVSSLQTSQSPTKLWTDGTVQLITQHTPQLSTDDQNRLNTAMFDPLAGCATWTVQQLMDSQGIQAIIAKSDDQQQQSVDVQLQELNPLGMLSYTPSETGDGDSNAVGTAEAAAASRKHQRSKESRRSWTSKHKPYACRHPGCRRSYFFVHDLRRHLRQKHGGMDYNEQSGQYEVAQIDDVGDLPHGPDSPTSPHDDMDDQSPDSEDEVSVAASTLGI